MPDVTIPTDWAGVEALVESAGADLAERPRHAAGFLGAALLGMVTPSAGMRGARALEFREALGRAWDAVSEMLGIGLADQVERDWRGDPAAVKGETDG